VTERVADAGLGASRVVRLGVPDGFVEHATRAGQLAELGLDAAGIARSVRAAWDAAGGGA
jgi:1-deoxy-D-xylulose-5-phosphate synthase